VISAQDLLGANRRDTPRFPCTVISTKVTVLLTRRDAPRFRRTVISTKVTVALTRRDNSALPVHGDLEPARSWRNRC
jgi:hypothetical protein